MTHSARRRPQQLAFLGVRLALALGFILAVAACRAVAAAEAGPITAAQTELFEKKIRPLLVERCAKCHGVDTVEAGLRLTSREAMMAGGDSGPAVVPGKPNDSLLVQAIEYLGDIQMPPEGRLSDSEIAAVREWVSSGAAMPAAPIATTTEPGPVRAFEPTAKHRGWWAFQPLARPKPPDAAGDATSLAEWPRNDIDRFVLAGMLDHGLAPAAEADRRTWLRRVTFDLTGLPPTEDELAVFLADDSSAAHDRVVDRLLASPAYGERQARHWLDVARYADAYEAGPPSHGSTADFELTEAWRYRNWVVSAFNRDLPFDRFIVRQIAGDLVPEPLDLDGSTASPGIDAAGLAATTFLSIGSWDHGDADKEKLVGDIVDDQIDTIGKAFLGLTLGCARCHDHKFDPVSTADYYALAGIFHSTRTLAALGAKGAASILNRVPLVPADAVKAHDEAAAAVAAVAKKLAELDKRMPKPAADDPERVALVAERDRLELLVPPKPPRAIAVQEGGVPGGLFPAIQDVPIHVRGSYSRLGPVVPRRMPAFFAGVEQPSISDGSGRRELAAWVASPENPLTPRVIVNRVWQWHFGRGLVTTPSNFGLLSEPPSHPALLDWLAAAFIDDGWSLKKLHRRIVLSATYRQSSRADAATVEADADNRWMARFTPRRLDAEEIRDAMLVAAARLAAPAGEAGVGGPAAYDLAAPRRSLYVQTTRWERANFSTLFDAANPDASVEARAPSTVAPQALFLLNSEFVQGIERDIVARLFREVPGMTAAADRGRIIRAWRIVLGRPPRPEEVEQARSLVAADAQAATPDDATARWADLAHVLVCGNEFFHVE